MFAAGLPRGRPDRQVGPVMAVHLVSLAFAFAALMYLGRHLWFFFDEWDVVGNPGLSLLAPHNEHWSTIPYLVYGALYPLFGLRTYAPYLAVTLLLHVGVAHLLWRLMLSAHVRPWVATALAGVFLFLGAGQENLVWAFQMGFVGSVFFGLLEVRLVDHDGPLGKRDVVAWVAAALALMCSDIGVLMVVMAGAVALLRRGPRAFVATVVPPAAVFLAWYAAYGRQGQAGHALPGLISVAGFVYSGLSSMLGQASGLDRFHLGGVLLLILGAWALVAARRLRREAPAALAGLVAVTAFFIFVSAGRADLGVDYSQSSRYLYIATAMVLPGVGVLLSSVVGLERRLEVVVVGLLLLSTAGGAVSLRDHYHAQTALDTSGERHILAAADLVGAGARIIGRIPDPHVAPQLDIDRVRLYRSQGALPVEAGQAAPSTLEREQVQVQLQLALRPQAELPLVPGALQASVAEAEVAVLPDGCWLVTSRGAAPELRLHANGPFAIELVPHQDSDLGLGGSPDGSVIQAVVAPLQLRSGVHAYLNSVLPAPAAATLGLRIGGSITVCGLPPVPGP